MRLTSCWATLPCQPSSPGPARRKAGHVACCMSHAESTGTYMVPHNLNIWYCQTLTHSHNSCVHYPLPLSIQFCVSLAHDRDNVVCGHKFSGSTEQHISLLRTTATTWSILFVKTARLDDQPTGMSGL
jgi:hypothetical protein